MGSLERRSSARILRPQDVQCCPSRRQQSVTEYPLLAPVEKEEMLSWRSVSLLDGAQPTNSLAAVEQACNEVRKARRTLLRAVWYQIVEASRACDCNQRTLTTESSTTMVASVMHSYAVARCFLQTLRRRTYLSRPRKEAARCAIRRAFLRSWWNRWRRSRHMPHKESLKKVPECGWRRKSRRVPEMEECFDIEKHRDLSVSPVTPPHPRTEVRVRMSDESNQIVLPKTEPRSTERAVEIPENSPTKKRIQNEISLHQDYSNVLAMIHDAQETVYRLCNNSVEHSDDELQRFLMYENMVRLDTVKECQSIADSGTALCSSRRKLDYSSSFLEASIIQDHQPAITPIDEDSIRFHCYYTWVEVSQQRLRARMAGRALHLMRQTRILVVLFEHWKRRSNIIFALRAVTAGRRSRCLRATFLHFRMMLFHRRRMRRNMLSHPWHHWIHQIRLRQAGKVWRNARLTRAFQRWRYRMVVRWVVARVRLVSCWDRWRTQLSWRGRIRVVFALLRARQQEHVFKAWRTYVQVTSRKRNDARVARVHRHARLQDLRHGCHPATHTFMRNVLQLWNMKAILRGKRGWREGSAMLR